MNKYKVQTSSRFRKKLAKLTKNNQQLKNKIDKLLEILSDNPFYPGLKTHKVDTIVFGIGYSTRVTGDLRIIWVFQDNELVILLLTIEGHEVYK